MKSSTKPLEIYGTLAASYSEMFSEPCQTAKMELFVKIVNDLKPLTIFAKRSVFGVWQNCEYASDIDFRFCIGFRFTVPWYCLSIYKIHRLTH